VEENLKRSAYRCWKKLVLDNGELKAVRSQDGELASEFGNSSVTAGFAQAA
jgi:hypothetical protein